MTTELPPLPVPDPTQATEQRIERGLKAERDYEDAKRETIVARLDAMDKATELLSDTVNRVPTDMQLVVGHLRELHDEEFRSVSLQFAERDKRSERESRDNKVAVDAAFAAQKEAASKQDEANQKAIDKSEKATAETITKLAELVETRIGGLVIQIDDVKARVGAIVAGSSGAQGQRTETRLNTGQMIAGLSAVFVAVAIIVSVLIAFHK
jgi:hypothetical protein